MAPRWKGGGMDKGYYWEDGELYGWLETSPEVKAREFAAREELLDYVAEYIPRLIDGNPPPSLIGQAGEEVKPECGYWVEHIPHKITFKPAMCAMTVMGPIKTRIVPALMPDARTEFVASLAAIRGQLEQICALIGELSIAVHEVTGKAYLLDYAPNEAGDVGGLELQLQAEKGIDNIVKLKQLNDAT